MSAEKTERFTFAKTEQARQIAYYGEHFGDRAGHLGRAFQLRIKNRFDGLFRSTQAQALFARHGIQWHTYIGHGRSSQACCLNFLMPFYDQPALLSRWLETLLGEPVQALPIEIGAQGEEWFVTFEYTGPGGIDYLDEAGGRAPQRGANATAADAAIAFVDASGRRQLLLIEWKYTEEYRNHRLSEDTRGTRIGRYAEKAFAPAGPIAPNLGLSLTDFFHEPFYQLLRQQMLAWRIENHPDSGFEKVRVLHLSPEGNRALHVVTAPALRTIAGVGYSDAFAAYRACLVDSDAFISRSIEAAFAPLADWPEADWCDALSARYGGLWPESATTTSD